MNRLLKMIPLVVAVSIVGGCGPNKPGEWQEYRPEGAGFKCTFPGLPAYSTAMTVHGTTLHTCLCEYPANSYGIAYADVADLDRMAKAELEKWLDDSVSGAVKVVGKLKKARAVTLMNRYPGRSCEFDTPEAGIISRCRFYAVGKQFYQMIVTGNTAFVNSPESNAFLDSLIVVTQ